MSPTKKHNALVQRNTALVAPGLDYILLDGSSSMMDKWDETLACLDQYFATLRSNNVSSHGILHVFAHPDLEYIQRDSAIEHWPAFDRSNVDIPGGSTPLWDATSVAIQNMATLDPPDGTPVTLVIVTDGENSRHINQQATQDSVKSLLDWCRAKGWQIIFLGADFDNQQDALRLGARKQEFIGVQKARMGDAGKTLAEKRIRAARTGGDIGFDDSEKTKFGGYLAAPTTK